MIRDGAIRIPFTYAAGEAGSKFLVALRDEQRILGSRCEACARTFCPTRAVCPDCGAPQLADMEVGPEGTIVSWTDVPDRGTFGLVRLASADTALLHRLLGDADRWTVGARVRARFRDERTASINDVEGFVLVTEGAT